ncbi:MAG: 1-(5-phosphoribosyl)-5-[(5-phosphoribosylamino)methylideneamino] imidazole-4-carboxamide isomerase [Ignavibacteriales bacterium]|nr:1-(5-phosphoribosyl)-5-[(5-phosphoribosylamino)methylideneamino] imidazole-4-carboxamide isomerase [Ignavibacteriales bacterium]
MLLIFPSIEIQKGECVNLVHGDPGSEHVYSVDPVQMAVLWRGENAKTLHIIDLDGVQHGTIRNIDLIKKIVQAVDLPIQVGGGIRKFEDIRALFDIGVYRVFVGTAAAETPALVEKVIREYGSRKMAISIESFQGKVRVSGGKKELNISPVDFALSLKKLGVSRALFSVIDADGKTKKLDLDALREIAETTGLRITAQGGVRNYQDLIRLQELEKIGVDSVVIGKPLYDNQFPCQRLWRLNEKDLKDLGPTRRM